MVTTLMIVAVILMILIASVMMHEIYKVTMLTSENLPQQVSIVAALLLGTTLDQIIAAG